MTTSRLISSAQHVLWVLVALLLVASPLGDVRTPTEDSSVECPCCPDKTPGDGEDCCDADGGLCCSTGSSAALLASAQDKDTLRAIAPQSHALLAIHLFLPRANGPPPTPPPIA